MSSPRRYDLLRTRLDRFTRMLPGIESGEPGAVHRARVASRRLRELLPVLEIEPAFTRKMGRRLKKQARRLGPVRELDVLAALVGELSSARRGPARALARVGVSVSRARDEARARLNSRDLVGRLKRTARKLEKVAEELDAADRGRSRSRGWRWAIDARVARRAEALTHAIREAGSMYVPERIHAVRLALKKLRYGVELWAESAGVKSSPELRALQRGQELLGRLRDFQVLIEHVRHVQASLRPPEVSAWRELDTLVNGLETSCRRLHARFVRSRAGLTAICDRLGARASASAARRAG